MRSPEEPRTAAECAEMIRAGLAGLAALDIPADGDATALGAECEDLLELAGRLQLQIARRLTRFEALGGPAADGAHSLAGWLGHRGRLRPWEARSLAVTGRHLHLLDAAVAALDTGEIGFGDVATIAEGVDTAAQTMGEEWPAERIAEAAQPVLVKAAPQVSPGRLRKLAAQISVVLDGEGAERRRRQIDRQAFLNLWQGMDGVGALRARMGAADLAVLEKAIDVFAAKPDSGAPRWANRAGRRRLRGLVTACEVALQAAESAGRRERGGAPVKVHLIASAHCADPRVDVTQAPPGRTEYGTIMPAGDVREMIRRHHAEVMTVRLGDDGEVVDRFTRDGRPLNWGRARRLFTAAQRDVFIAKYAGCAAEGCDRPVAWSAIDHKIEWIRGGRTDLDNGQPLCDWHNLHKEHQRHRNDPPAPEDPPQGGDGAAPPPGPDP